MITYKCFQEFDDKFNYLETIVQEKTKSYAFIAHRRRGFTHQNSIVTYDDVNLNAAGAVNAGTGFFTAPVKGIYFVSFLGLKEQQSDNRKYYQLDVEFIKISGWHQTAFARTWVHNRDYYANLPAPMQALVFLEKGEQVAVKLVEGHLHAPNAHMISFMGYLVEAQ